MPLRICESEPPARDDSVGSSRRRDAQVGPLHGPVHPTAPADIDRVETAALRRMNGGRLAIDTGGVATLAAPVTTVANVLVCPDLRAAGDAKRPWWNRLMHAALLGTVVGGPDAAALKALGLHVAETAATHTVFTAVQHAAAGGASVAGRIVVPTGVRAMSDAERSAAAYLAKQGHEVVRIPESPTEKTADFLVDGKPTELKTISNITGRDLGKSVIRRIREGFSQAPNVLVDARGQAGMDKQSAQIILDRIDSTSFGEARTVRIFGNGFDLKGQF